MQRVILIVLIIIVLTSVVFLLFGTGICYLLSDDTIELANRAACGGRQKRLYSALDKYATDHGHLPSQLLTLVAEGYIQQSDIYCLATAHAPDKTPYKYFPENFLDPNSPVISGNVENHSGKKMRLRKVKPALIQTMGNGRVLVLTINNTNQ